MNFLTPVYLSQMGVTVLLLAVGLFLWWQKSRQGDKEELVRWSLRAFWRLSFALIASITSLQIGGWFAMHRVVENRLGQIQRLVGGYAPTLSLELENRGHARLHWDTPMDDSLVINLLELVGNWQRLNPTVQSMYTMRRTPSGAWRFVLAPAADLNLDGKIEGDLEETDPIGLLYEEAIPEMDEAWNGKVVFQRIPSQDQWGAALTVFCPLRDSSQQVESIFGIDFDAPTLAREIHTELIMIVSILWLLQLLGALGVARLWLTSQVAFHTKTEREMLAGFANTDGLTGLHNRRFLEMRFAQEMENDSAVLNPRALLIFDIDRYKRINDTWGHLVGDQVLIDLASLLREQLRGRDVIARWGGDEFVVLLLETNGPEAEHVAEMLRRRVEMRPFPPTDGVTCSFGLAGIYPGDTLEAVMKRADQALYQVKENGRNGVISDF